MTKARRTNSKNVYPPSVPAPSHPYLQEIECETTDRRCALTKSVYRSSSRISREALWTFFRSRDAFRLSFHPFGYPSPSPFRLTFLSAPRKPSTIPETFCIEQKNRTFRCCVRDKNKSCLFHSCTLSVQPFLPPLPLQLWRNSICPERRDGSQRSRSFSLLFFVFFFFFFLPPFFLRQLALSKKIRRRDWKSIGGRTDGFFFQRKEEKEEKSVGDSIFDHRSSICDVCSRFWVFTRTIKWEWNRYYLLSNGNAMFWFPIDFEMFDGISRWVSYGTVFVSSICQTVFSVISFDAWSILRVVEFYESLNSKSIFFVSLL